MSNGALRKDDSLFGTASYHKEIPENNDNIPQKEDDLPDIVEVSGKIITGSNNVYINNKAAARKDDITQEIDICDDDYQNGKIGSGSNSVFINNKPAARKKDTLIQHKGFGEFTTSSDNVFIGD